MTQKAILFDLDGTLVDSVPDLAAAVNALLAELGRPALSRAQVTGMVGDGAAKLVERALAASGAGDTPLRAALDRFLALYEADPTHLTRPYDGVPAVLAELAAAGWASASAPTSPSAPREPCWRGWVSNASSRWCSAVTAARRASPTPGRCVPRSAASAARPAARRWSATIATTWPPRARRACRWSSRNTATARRRWGA